MATNDWRAVLRQVEAGELTADEAAEHLRQEIDLGFARLDVDRVRRRGFPEVIFSPGKTIPQLINIVTSLAAAGQDVFATRVSAEQAAAVCEAVANARYHEEARAITVDVMPRREPVGLVVVAAAGTSDLPVAEEAALTAERLGARVERVYDIGVAGLHRAIKHLPLLRKARCLVVVAGMEGALPSVIGGLVDRPIIAVPTSIGYGTGFKGIAALLAMLNSCVPGISVVNIDNGFGAGVAAALANRLPEDEGTGTP
jgi:NCAIR mutase (PurE)-related protein